MRVVVIGAGGTIGRAVCAALVARGHEVVRASRTSGIRVDLAEPAGLDVVFSGADAVVCCAASAPLGAVAEGDDAEFTRGLREKLVGQVMLVRRAFRLLRDGGVVVVTAGEFGSPTPGSAMGALVNAGLRAFVEVAALEAPRGIRVAVVSPGWVTETLGGTGGTPAEEVARRYVDLLT